MFAQFRVSENKFPNFTLKTRPTKRVRMKMRIGLFWWDEEDEEDEEGRRGVPSGQTTPDGPSVLPTDRFIPPTLPWTDRTYYLH